MTDDRRLHDSTEAPGIELYAGIHSSGRLGIIVEIGDGWIALSPAEAAEFALALCEGIRAVNAKIQEN